MAAVGLRRSIQFACMLLLSFGSAFTLVSFGSMIARQKHWKSTRGSIRLQHLIKIETSITFGDRTYSVRSGLLSGKSALMSDEDSSGTVATKTRRAFMFQVASVVIAATALEAWATTGESPDQLMWSPLGSGKSLTSIKNRSSDGTNGSGRYSVRHCSVEL
jgi:hypothetical protein